MAFPKKLIIILTILSFNLSCDTIFLLKKEIVKEVSDDKNNTRSEK